VTVLPEPEAHPPASGAQAKAPACAPGDANGAGALSRPVPLDMIRPAPDQPRRAFDTQSLLELAESIRVHGVLQPVLLRADGDGYVLVAGERRWRAARLAGLDAVPAVVTELDGSAAIEAALIENLQREDLSPVEEARILRRMVEAMGYSIRGLAARLGKGKGYIEDRLRLTRLPDDLREMVEARPDTLTHARELEHVEDAATRRALAASIREEGLPLSEVRRQVRALHGAADGGGANAESAVSGAAPAPRTPTAAAAGDGSELAAGAEQLMAACRALRSAIRNARLDPDPAAYALLMTELKATEEEVHALLVRVWTDSLVQQVGARPPTQ